MCATNGISMTPRLLALIVALTGCVPSGADGIARLADPDAPLPARDTPPDEADSSSCWATVGAPPVLATLEDEVVVEPAGLAPDGTLREDPVTQIARRELVVEPGTQVWFETLCPEELTEARVASLQRALAVRNAYGGPVTGVLDAATNSAIQSFQKSLGLDSPTLSRAAAERLGLIVVAPPT